nr:MAG TPA: hypothetical protein [Bacteriophage sp.]
MRYHYGIHSSTSRLSLFLRQHVPTVDRHSTLYLIRTRVVVLAHFRSVQT